MATPQIILPFPENIDRIQFADWLSGFTAGEGCFGLKLEKRRYGTTGSARFEINLRRDDRLILEQIQSFFGCGLLFDSDRPFRSREKPVTRFHVARTADLVSLVIPQFDAHPIRAKKAGDFAVWREGVLLLASIKERRRGHRSGGIERHTTWTDRDLVVFSGMVDALKSQRVYRVRN